MDKKKSNKISKEDILKNDGESFTALDKKRHLSMTDYNSNKSKYIKISGLDEYTFKNEDEIRGLVEQLVARNRDAYIYPVTYVYDPKIMIRCGLYPTSFNFMHSWFIEWLEGIDIDTLEFWNPDSNFKHHLTNIHKELRWQYHTLDYWRKDALEKANSIPLKLHAPELLYTDSLRPKTDMIMFRNPTPHKISRKQIYKFQKDENGILTGIVLINNVKWYVIPVTRYAAGMKRGLYFNTNSNSACDDCELKKEYCGTFYYYEPTSTTLLAYNKSMSFFNKTTALRKLDPKNELLLYTNPEIEKHINGELPEDLMMTPIKAAEYHYSNPIEKAELLPQVPHYAGTFLEMYAAEDLFDQPICRAAKNIHDLDIIVLRKMIGSFQPVTEVMDTRSKEDSFRSLVYIID